jgi:hypothetical protein
MAGVIMTGHNLRKLIMINYGSFLHGHFLLNNIKHRENEREVILTILNNFFYLLQIKGILTEDPSITYKKYQQ